MYKYSAKTRQQGISAAADSQTMGITDNQALAAMSQYYDDSRKSARQVDIGDALRARMSASFGSAAGDVKIYSNSGIAAIGEKGFAKGNEVHLAPSVLSDSSSLESVLSHEMTHIAQQSAGRAYGSGLLMNDAQESEANSGMGMQIGTLASADYAPMQGNLATGLWKRMKNKVKTKFNIGGYADRKQQARADVAHTLDSGTPLADTFEHEIGQSRLVDNLDAISQSKNASSDDYLAHYREAAAPQIAGMSEDYKDTIASMRGDFDRYHKNQRSQRDETDDERIGRTNERMKALSLMEAKLNSRGPNSSLNDDANVKALRKKINATRDEEVSAMRFLPGYQEGLQSLKQRVEAVQHAESKDVESHNRRLDDLKSVETDMYKFQKRFDGAAYDTMFGALNIRISQLFKQLYNMTDANEWDFHRAGTKDAAADQKANELWKSVKNGTGGLSIGTERAEFGGKDKEGNLTGLGEDVKGFREATLGNLGRILSTNTGLDLVDSLANGNNNSTTIRPVSYKNSAKTALNGPGAAGWDNEKKSRMNADTVTANNFIVNNGGTLSANKGVDALAMYNHNTADKDMNAVLEDGTTVMSPQYVALAHEMMHALHNNKGINMRHHKPDNYRFIGQGRWSNLEELSTMYGTNKVEADTLDSAAADFSVFDDNTKGMMQKYVGNINEQKMRDELGLNGRYGHATPKSTVINPRKKKV